MRVCKFCGHEGPNEDFSPSRIVNGVQHYNGRCKPCYNAYSREKRTKYKGSLRDKHLQRQYGISADDFDRMLADQGGGCAICGSDDAGHWGNLHVDHNHITGQVRGILCASCNLAIGKLRSDEGPELLLKAVSYVQAQL